MNDVAHRIADNLARVRGRMAAAAARCGRSADAIMLVAVTKSVSVEIAAALVEAGCTDLGESRPQELWAKAAALAEPRPNATGGEPASAGATGILPVSRPVRWHLVGHLQRNKIRRTLPLVHLIHSVDSRRLLDALQAEAARLGRPAALLLEANISGDITKTGLAPHELEPILADAARWPHVSIRGLMGMASLVGGTDAAKRDFHRLGQLRERLAKNLPPGASLAELSMGMSGDFEVAIEAGATIVRVGTALVEGFAP
jgi:uncharacterized pyridoxal phosphate-containing UPF0001 family protein